MDDLISRQAAIAAIQNLYPGMPKIDVFGSLNRWREKNKQYIECEYVINILPSVKQKKGKWIKRAPSLYRCSKCARFSPAQESFCPNCGSEML